MRMRAVAKTMRAETGDGHDLTDLAIQQSEVLTLRTLLSYNEGEVIVGGKEGGAIARMVRTNTATKREKAKFDEEQAARIRAQAADDAEGAAREIGATAAQIDTIRRRILGVN